MRGDLTTLARVRNWLAPGTGSLSTDNDATLRLLITSASVFVLNYIQRGIIVTDYDEWYDSGGLNFLSLRQWPILDVESVQFGSITVSEPATGVPPLSGWRVTETSRLMVEGYSFPRGRSVVRVQYTAGYRIVDEAHQITSSGSPVAVVPVSTYQMWLADIGVTMNGVAMTLVTGTPASGQYAVSDEGVYTFSLDDVGETVLITYSYCPADLCQAVTEMIGEKFKYRERIGVRSKSLPNGESVTFELRDMTAPVRSVVDLYVRRFM